MIVPFKVYIKVTIFTRYFIRFMKKIILLIFFSLLVNQSDVQAQGLLKEFCRISYQEQLWVLKHPFIAKEAFQLSMRAREVSDSLMQLSYTDSIRCDGITDAMRHTFWMALLSSRFSTRKACKLGCAHEIANYENKTTTIPDSDCYHDSAATAMDIHNNQVGLRIGTVMKDTSEQAILNTVLDSIKEGNCVLIHKDERGNFLNQNNEPVSPSKLRNKWVTPRRLVPTEISREP